VVRAESRRTSVQGPVGVALGGSHQPQPRGDSVGRVSSFHDDRMAGRGRLNVKVTERDPLGVRLRARYDSARAPRPPPSGTSWQARYVPLADRLDTASSFAFL
jgi:hypothetical protein